MILDVVVRMTAPACGHGQILCGTSERPMITWCLLKNPAEDRHPTGVKSRMANMRHERPINEQH